MEETRKPQIPPELAAELADLTAAGNPDEAPQEVGSDAPNVQFLQNHMTGQTSRDVRFVTNDSIDTDHIPGFKEVQKIVEVLDALETLVVSDDLDVQTVEALERGTQAAERSGHVLSFVIRPVRSLLALLGDISLQELSPDGQKRVLQTQLLAARTAATEFQSSRLPS